MNMNRCITTIFLMGLVSLAYGQEIDLTEDYAVYCSGPPRVDPGRVLTEKREWDGNPGEDSNL